MKISFKLPVYGLLLFISNSLFAQEVCSDNRYESAIITAERLIDSLQQKQRIPGIDVAISFNGIVVWSEAFGYADVEKEAPIETGKTRFRIGSISKSLTSSALGKLKDNGSLNFNDPIQKYVKYFPEKKYPITVKEVSGHIAGIRHYKGNEWLNTQNYKTVRSGLSIFINDPLQFKPGTKYLYTSHGYNLLSAVVEGASKEEFLSYMRHNIFYPLGMYSTLADKKENIIPNRTSFYVTEKDTIVKNAPYVDNSYKWAGGGFLSTTADLLKFGQAHIAPGFLKPETLTELTTPMTLSNGNSTGYGMGWGVINRDGLIGYGHNGGSVGGISELQIFPNEQAVFIIISNSSNTTYGEVTAKIIKAFTDIYKLQNLISPVE